MGCCASYVLRGLQRVGWMFTFAAAAYNLVRMRNLMLKCA